MSILSEVEELRREAVEKWRRKGYDEELIRMAIRFADRWLINSAKFYVGLRPDILKQVVRERYRYALHVAESWLTEMSK